MSAAGAMVTEPPSAAATYPIAELDRRFYAFALDRLFSWSLVALAGAGAWLALDDVWQSLGVAAGTIVVVWVALAVWLGVGGSSPGKAVAGLRVVHQGTGTPIGVGRALLRSAVLALASIPTFALGLVTLAWTAVEDPGRQRRGWHDQVAHSVVVDVRPVDPDPEAVDEAPRHVVNLTAMRLIPPPPIEVATPTPSRRTNPEQSVRRPTVVPEPPAPPPPAARAGADQPPTPDDGRTVVRPKRTQPVGPRWRVRFDDGETFVVEGLALVGRRPEPRAGEQVHHLVPLSSGDMSVSKTHAQFGPAADGVLVVMDRGSTNGSVLIRSGVPRPLGAGKPATLIEGDTVSFGDRQMTVSREA